MKIYIPTLGRVDNQMTYDNIPKSIQSNTYFVIQPKEELLFKELWPDSNILVLPEDDYGILNTRKWIVETAGESKYMMIDDDIVFWKRNVDRKTGKKNAEKSNEPFTPEDWNDLMNWAESKLDNGYTVAGSRARGMPPHPKEDIEFSRIMQVFFIDGTKLYRDKLEWVLDSSEDVHFIIQVLQMGGKIVTSDKFLYVCEDYHSDGGCKLSGRTSDSSLKDMNTLAEMYPKFIHMKNEFLELKNEFTHQKHTLYLKKAYNPFYGKTDNKYW